MWIQSSLTLARVPKDPEAHCESSLKLVNRTISLKEGLKWAMLQQK
jgi:hypothetical protein